MSLRASHQQLLEILARHPELRDCLHVGRRVHNAVRTTTSIGGLAWWLFFRIDADDACFFVDRLCDGADLTDGSPILALRKALINNAAARAKQPDFVVIALVIKAWNAYRQGRTMQVLAWKSGGAAPEAFPEPV